MDTCLRMRLSLMVLALVALLPGCAADVLVTGPAGEDDSDATTLADTNSADSADGQVVVDIAVDTGPICPGQAGCACKADADCPGSVCSESATGPVCAGSCTSGLCPLGQVCRTVSSATASIKACLPANPRLCNPCHKSKDCQSPADPAGQCVTSPGDTGGLQGWFCGSMCNSNLDCPAAFACALVSRIDGPPGQFCVPTSGQCDCSKAAISAALTTNCAKVGKDASGNVLGTCPGTRTCGSSGLSACSAGTPVAEICDGLDNNCNNQKDEGTPCDDKNACTVDVCLGATGCSHTKIDSTCDDANPCTDDSCDPASGCLHSNNSKTCDDGTACTTGDLCSSGACKGQALLCDDGNLCTDDSCNKTSGCKHMNIKKPCDDGNACTQNDGCTAGSCVGYSTTCDDKNPCTQDSCAPASGCTTTANDKPCNDGNICTTGDLCVGGVCGGQAANCDDQNPCTLDTCKSVGCTHAKQDGAACEDGNACTTGDQCSGATCVAGPPKVCDDGSPCTSDSCDIKLGCTTVNLAQGLTCTDGNACTQGDACAGSLCVGKAANCDDGNPCTTDSCDSKLGCLATPLSGPVCDDGNPCTNNDVCNVGLCKGLNVINGTSCGAAQTCQQGKCQG